jgi:hypothetical protein
VNPREPGILQDVAAPLALVKGKPQQEVCARHELDRLLYELLRQRVRRIRADGVDPRRPGPLQQEVDPAGIADAIVDKISADYFVTSVLENVGDGGAANTRLPNPMRQMFDRKQRPHSLGRSAVAIRSAIDERVTPGLRGKVEGHAIAPNCPYRRSSPLLVDGERLHSGGAERAFQKHAQRPDSIHTRQWSQPDYEHRSRGARALGHFTRPSRHATPLRSADAAGCRPGNRARPNGSGGRTGCRNSCSDDPCG